MIYAQLFATGMYATYNDMLSAPAFDAYRRAAAFTLFD